MGLGYGSTGGGGGGGGITTLNGLTAAVQTFAVASGGSDFAISSNVNVHNFSIPDAGVAARGLVTTGAQTFGGTKSFSAVRTASITSATSIQIVPEGGAGQLYGSDGVGAGNGSSGAVQGGAGGPTNGTGGTGLLTGGSGGGTNGIGGDAQASGGSASGTGAAGAGRVRGGSNSGSGASGAAQVYGGAALGSGVGGPVEIYAGASGGTNAGADVNILGGTGGDTDGDGGNVNIDAGTGQGAGVAGVVNIAAVEAGVVNIGTAEGSIVNIAEPNTGMLGFFGYPAVALQNVPDFINNVAAGGSDSQVDNYTSLTVYASDAATIRNNIYQLASKVDQICATLTLYGLFDDAAI